MDKTPRPREHHGILRWIPALVWAGIIFAGSSVPGTNIPGGYSVYGHLGEYFVLAALALWAARREDRRTVLLILALCALYGASDEFHQAFVPFRTPDPVDWLTDVAGAAVGVSVFLWWTVRSRRKSGARQ